MLHAVFQSSLCVGSTTAKSYLIFSTSWPLCASLCPDVADHRFVKSGSWDSIHVVEATPSSDGKVCTYKLTTTVMLSMVVDNVEVGDTNLSGSITRQVSESHLHK